MKYFREILPYILVILIVFLLRQFVVTPIKVVGNSMYPTLKDGEYMLLDKISYKFNEIERFDIVVVHQEDSPIIKRIIGLPGEKIEYINNRLYVNGKEIYENFEINGKTEDFNINILGENIVPENCYFVVGDNRINSKDSRMIGFITKEDIEGKAFFVLYPFDKFGKI